MRLSVICACVEYFLNLFSWCNKKNTQAQTYYSLRRKYKRTHTVTSQLPCKYTTKYIFLLRLSRRHIIMSNIWKLSVWYTGKYILVIIVIINFNLIVVCSVCQRFLALMSFDRVCFVLPFLVLLIILHLCAHFCSLFCYHKMNKKWILLWIQSDRFWNRCTAFERHVKKASQIILPISWICMTAEGKNERERERTKKYHKISGNEIIQKNNTKRTARKHQ